MAGLRVGDVARRLNVSEKTVYKWLRQGLIPASRIGKTWIITEESVDAVLQPAGITPRVRDSERPSVYSSAPGSGAVDRVEAFQRGQGSRSGFRQESARADSNRSNLHGAGVSAAALKAVFSQFNRTLSGAIENGIDGILGPRRVDPATPAAIASDLESAEGEVLLQGIGLREFFGDTDYTMLLRHMAAEDRAVRVRALMVSPTGQFARARSVVQHGEQFADDSRFRAGPLFADSWRSLNVIASLRRASQRARRFSLDVRFIDHWPSVYLVMTRAAAFVETYHFGKEDPGIDGSTIDGLVPMLQINPESSYYTLLRNHFDYLWSGRNPFVPSLTLEQVAHEMQVQV